LGNGTIKTAKRPKEFKNKSLKESLNKPVAEGTYALLVMDLSKFASSDNLQAGF